MISTVLFILATGLLQVQNDYPESQTDSGAVYSADSLDYDYEDEDEDEDSLVFVTRNFDLKAIDSLRNLPEYQYDRGAKKEPSLLGKLLAWIQDAIIRPVLGSKLFSFLFLIGAALLMVWVMFKLMRINAGPLFFKRKDDSIKVFETDEDLIRREISLEELATLAEQAGAWREMIRFWFLNLLKTMDREKTIRWAPDKTNLDYIRELRNESFIDEFRRICFITDEMTWSEKQATQEEAINLLNRIKSLNKEIAGQGKKK